MLHRHWYILTHILMYLLYLISLMMGNSSKECFM
nr:MAG TPA: hypothetical protein [Caudoviricetes sp.]